MTSSPRRAEEDRKKNSLRSFVNVFLKLPPDQSPAGINREHLRWGGCGGGRGGATVTGGGRREGKSLKMPRDKRITDQYGRMDFVILKIAVREVDSHLLGAPRAAPAPASSVHPLFFAAIVNLKRECSLRWAGVAYLGPELTRKHRSALSGGSSPCWLFDWEPGALLTGEVD